LITTNDESRSLQRKSILRVDSSGFILNIISGIVAYCLKEKKPGIRLSPSELRLMVTYKNRVLKQNSG